MSRVIVSLAAAAADRSRTPTTALDAKRISTLHQNRISDGALQVWKYTSRRGELLTAAPHAHDRAFMVGDIALAAPSSLFREVWRLSSASLMAWIRASYRLHRRSYKSTPLDCRRGLPGLQQRSLPAYAGECVQGWRQMVPGARHRASALSSPSARVIPNAAFLDEHGWRSFCEPPHFSDEDRGQCADDDGVFDVH